MTFGKVFSIVLLAIFIQACGYDAPNDGSSNRVALSKSSIEEGRGAGTLIGELSIESDPAATFLLIDDAGGRFQLNGVRLETSENRLDFDVATEHQVTVSSRLTSGEEKQQSFTIQVIDQALIAGLISKGPFQNAVVRVGYIQNGQLIQQAHRGETEQQPAPVEGMQTSYEVYVEPNANVVIQVDGAFTNEVSGGPVELVEPLTAFVFSGGDQQQNINVVSHLLANSARQLVLGGASGLQAIEQATERVGDLLGFAAGDNLTALDVNQVADGDDLSNPNLRLALLSAAVMGLPQRNGRMPAQWDDINVEIADPQSNPFEVFSGVNSRTLFERVENAGVFNLPAVQVDDGTWVCDLICDFVDASPGIHLANASAYEGRGKAELVVRRVGDASNPVTVLLSYQGELAVLGEDFDQQFQTVTIPAGKLEAIATVGLVIDQLAEQDEKIVATILNVSDGSDIVRGAANITILDDVPTDYANRNTAGIALDDQCLIAIGDPLLIAGEPCAQSGTAELVLSNDRPAAVRLSAQLRSDCSDSATLCFQETEYWQLNATLVSTNATGEETARASLGSYLYSGADVLRLSDSADLGSVQFTASLSSGTISQLLDDARDSGDNVQIELQLDGSASLARVDFPLVRTLAGEIVFGDRAVPFLPSNATVEQGGGSCAAEDFQLLTQIPLAEQAVIDEIISGADSTAAAQFSSILSQFNLPVDVCVSLSDSQPAVATVSSGEVDLEGSLWLLPPGHGVIQLKADPTGSGRFLPLGPAQRFFRSPGINEFQQLLVDGLPVSLFITQAQLTADGFEVVYGGINYLQRPQFSLSDPRNGVGFYSNDIHFNTTAQGNLILDTEGLSGDLSLGLVDDQRTAFPEGRLFVAPRPVRLVAGKVQTDVADVVFAVEQSTGCREAGCEAGLDVISSAEGEIAIDGRGRSFGSIATAIDSEPEIGKLPSGLPIFARPDDLSGAPKQITYASAGYAFDPALPVAAQLPGHIQDDVAQLVLHDTRSRDFQRGNYAPVGLSVGPEIYADAAGQPVVGNGRDLEADNTFQHINGAASIAFRSRTATKYVIRSHGLTGVFNALLDGSNSDVDIYGYPVRFDRFAFRFVNNQIDEFNWVDGNLPLAGDATLNQIAFTNLGLDCAGRFNSGNLVFESCDASDNNGNGLIDENCPTLLGAFKMDATVNAMRFADSGGGALACGSSSADLVLSHTIEPLVLSNPISVDLAWTPDGFLAGFQEVKGLGSYFLDQRRRGEGFGFPVSLKNAEFKVAEDNVGRYGFMQGENLTAVPFWEAVNGDYRIANQFDSSFSESGAAPAPTVMTPLGFLTNQAANPLAGVDFDQFNTSVVNELKALAQDEEIDVDQRGLFDASYRWGNTGIGFDLPVYFSPGIDNGDEEIPSFIGVKRQYSNLVLDVNAGVNFIQPQRTKFSFGASADITPLLELEFKVDLQNGESLEKIDALLVKLNIISGPKLAPLYNDIKDKVDVFNRFADRGIDDLTEKAIKVSVTQLGERAAPISPLNEDPFVTASAGLQLVKSLPDQIMTLVDAQVVDPLFSALDDSAASLRQPLLEMRADLDAMTAGTTQANPLFEEAQREVDAMKLSVRKFHGDLAQVQERAERKKQSVERILSNTQGAIDEVEVALGTIEGVLAQSVEVIGDVCKSPNQLGSEANGFLTDFFERLNVTQGLVAAVQNSEVLLPLVELATDDPATKESLSKAQGQLQSKAELLQQRLSEAETTLREELCSGTVEETLANAQQLLTELQGNLLLVELQIVTVETKLFDGYNKATGLYSSLVLGPFEVVIDELEDISDQFAKAKKANTAVSGQAMLDQLEDALVNEIKVFGIDANKIAVAGGISSDTTERDIFYAVTLLAKSEVSKVRNDIRKDLDEAFNSVLPGGGYTPDELRTLLVGEIMESDPVRAIRDQANTALVEIRRQINELIASLTDQINNIITPLVARVEETVNEKLNEAQSALGDLPMRAGKVDGFAVINGNELERAHIGAEWTMAPSADGEPGKTFKAALDAVSLSLTDEAAGCDIPPDESPLEITISAYNLPMGFGESALTAEKIYLGMVLDQAQAGNAAILLPDGVFGGIYLRGEISLTEFKIYDPAFAAGIGKRELYLGARAGAVFSTISAEAAFLAGKLCDNDVLFDLDPQVVRFIPVPENGFAGAYIRGAASIPVWTMGCPLTVGVAADVGAWVLAGPPTTIGGLVGGGAFGKVGCIGALRGQIRATGSVTTEGDLAFAGQGFGIAGIGLCEPSGWTSVERSREDGLCGTVDAIFTAGYVNGWSVFDLGVSGPH